MLRPTFASEREIAGWPDGYVGLLANGILARKINFDRYT